MTKDELLVLIRTGKSLTRRDQLKLAALLSFPAMLSQLSTIAMQYIDAAMVGSLGASASAAIALVSTTTWLLGGLSHSVSTGFYVQVAHHVGGNDFPGARDVFRQGITTSLIFSSLLMLVGIGISPWLPEWLGGDVSICHDSSLYLAIFCLTLPLSQLTSLSAGVLRCSGNVKIPAMVQALTCALDVVFNYVLIFQMGMGVLGAALGTVAAQLVATILVTWYASVHSQEMNLRQDGKRSFRPDKVTLRWCLNIAGPMGIEHVIMCGAQIASTIIVAPLGTVALAANGFGIIVESLCYMPGYGMADAATTLVGQSLGAKRKYLARRFAFITVAAGVTVMSLMAVVMYVTAPWMMELMSPDVLVQELTTDVLRIEAWAEPGFAAAIVCYGVFVGAGDTKIPCTMNLASIWAVRITLAALLAGTMGLKGVWIAMAIELCFRGAIFLWRLRGDAWMKAGKDNG